MRARQQVIVGLIKRKVKRATSDYINAKADLAKTETGKQLWEKHEEERGDIASAFNQAPYDVNRARAQVTTSWAELMVCQEVLDYAIEVFLSKIPDEKGD
jgi:hypothetical protein